MLQHSVGQYREQLGNFVRAESTALGPALVCWRRTDHGECVDSGDLLNWSEDKKGKRNTNKHFDFKIGKCCVSTVSTSKRPHIMTLNAFSL